VRAGRWTAPSRNTEHATRFALSRFPLFTFSLPSFIRARIKPLFLRAEKLTVRFYFSRTCEGEKWRNVNEDSALLDVGEKIPKIAAQLYSDFGKDFLDRVCVRDQPQRISSDESVGWSGVLVVAKALRLVLRT
jgi:hypothetical protein